MVSNHRGVDPNPAPEPARYRDQLERLFRVAIEAALPGPAVREALRQESPATDPFVLAVGKAALPMAEAAIETLAARGSTPAGGLVVCPEPSPLTGLDVIAGQHPLPGERSAEAALAIGDLTRRLPPDAYLWMLLSGGATSLMAGPDEGLTLADLRQCFDALLRSGLDIGAMNAVRKRLTRWGGGKLARAVAGASVLQLIVSDVIGDDLPSIGSGPMVPDPTDAASVLAQIRRAGVPLPPAVEARLEAMATGRWPDTPRAGDPVFDRVRTRVIASNRQALDAVAAAARQLGWEASVLPAPLQHGAAQAGRTLVEQLSRLAAPSRPHLLIEGGEPTVQLGASAGMGGRAQELALAAAAGLATRAGLDILVLAGGTDGRDGPTDAAGALVDGTTWQRIAAAGLDPAGCLAEHDSYPALDRAGDLIRTGPTGTNVMDVVLGLRLPA